MTSPGIVAVDSTANLSTQHDRPLNTARPVLCSETCPKKKARGSLRRQHRLCCFERSAVLSTATLPGVAILTLYLILNITSDRRLRT